MLKRNIEIAVISDVHLGTYGCQSKALNNYLKSIQPEILILNGDIVDVWQFSKRFWPESHMKVIQRITKMMANGTKVYYLTGNHDEMLRRFTDFKLGNFELLNKLVLERNGKKMWFFHGDVFDVTMKHSKWLAKLGAIGYDTLIIINSFVNFVLRKLGRKRISLSQKVKNSVKGAIKFINDFEQTAADIAIDNEYDFVICGHIHQPAEREYKNNKGSVTYLNSGDWVENMTALEYDNGKWSLYKHKITEGKEDKDTDSDLGTKEALMIHSLYEDIVRHTGNRKRAHQ